MPGKNKYGETIYFNANGLEPFWGLEMTEENFKFTLNSVGFETFIQPHSLPISTMNANVKMYCSATQDKEMKIQIVQQPCTDEMSGKKNKYQITIELKRGIDKDFKRYKD